MKTKYPENHPNGYTSRQLAFIDARVAVASLCANDRSPEYKAAVTEALGAIDKLGSRPPPTPEPVLADPIG